MTVDPTTLRALNDKDEWVNLPPYPSPSGYDDTELRALITTLATEVDENAQRDAEEDAAAAARMLELDTRLSELAALPDDDIDDEARAEIDQAQADIQMLKDRPTGTGTGSSGSAFFPGKHFNSFAGANDEERFTSLFAWENTLGTGPYTQVWFDQRLHQHIQQIPFRARRRWVGGIGPAREFNSSTVIKYAGPAGTSQFKPYVNTGYNYPANGVTRDAHYTGIQWSGNLDQNFLPKVTGWDASKVLWYGEFHDCGWVGFNEPLRYYGTGMNVDGTTHLQAYAKTPISVGGSESLFLDSMSLMDSGNASFIATDQPAVNFWLSKSVLGVNLISARNKAYSLLVSGGHGSKAMGSGFDGPAGYFMQNGAVRFDGSAVDFGLSDCSFKGIASPAIQCRTGNTQVTVDGCSFNETDALARCEASFNGVLLWALNKYGDLAKAVIYLARGKQLISLDPRVIVKSLDGTLTGIRNPDGTYTSAYRVNSDGSRTTVPF